MAWATALAVATGVAGCMGRTRGAALYPEVAEHQNEEIKKIRFVGNEPFTADTLQTLIDSQASHCNLLGLPICIPFLKLTRQVHRLNVETVRRDVARLSSFYRREGYFGTRVVPRAEPHKGSEDNVDLTFVVRRGDPITLDSLTVEGTEGILDSAAISRALLIEPGDQFDVAEYEASADLVLRDLQSRGYAYAEVLRNYSVDTLSDRAVASIVAVPGPQVRVDSIVVVGAENLGPRHAIRQLSFREGDLLRLSTLNESQSNLYNLEIVQLASVTIAPDSLQKTRTDSSTTTVLVSIAEAPVNRADAALGYGRFECFRVQGDWTNRSFTGGARRLNTFASVSRIGSGGATNAGLGGNVCQASDLSDQFGTLLIADSAQNGLDYRFAAEFRQPYFLSPRRNVLLSVYAERLSEPGLYQRRSEGGRFSVTHRLAPRSLLTGSVDIERAKTLSSPLLFCTAFQVCLESEIERMTVPRFRNTIGANYVLDRTDNALDPSVGHLFRTAVAWAAPWLGSTLTFTRFSGEGAIYRTVKPGWVFATSLRLGNFFRSASLNPLRADDDFLPPEDRFYAGGATTVRGYSRNALGHGVYLTFKDTVLAEDGVRPVDDDKDPPNFVPLGGTSLAVVNAEIRFPSPLLRRRLRLAAFIDGGTISTGNIWNLDTRDWRFTPGVGMRIQTPVGPARVDLAYNPYNPVAGVLFRIDSISGITKLRDDYAPPPPGFVGRLRVHLGIGQAF